MPVADGWSSFITLRVHGAGSPLELTSTYAGPTQLMTSMHEVPACMLPAPYPVMHPVAEPMSAGTAATIPHYCTTNVAAGCLERNSSNDSWSGTEAGLLPSADWARLPDVLLSAVTCCLKKRVRDVLKMTGVCRAWRTVVLTDTLLLKDLHFPPAPTTRATVAAVCAHQLLPVLQHHEDMPVSQQSSLAHVPHSLGTLAGMAPQLLVQAARAGSSSGCAYMARLLESAGDVAGSLRWWDRAAKRGHVEGKVMMGLALYRGATGVPHDADKAYMWLDQGARQLLEDPSSVLDTTRQRVMLSQSALVLGYLHFDGETCRFTGGERQEAVRWFKVAAGQGNKEAEEVLGWIFNTGQYG